MEIYEDLYYKLNNTFNMIFPKIENVFSDIDDEAKTIYKDVRDDVVNPILKEGTFIIDQGNKTIAGLANTVENVGKIDLTTLPYLIVGGAIIYMVIKN